MIWTESDRLLDAARQVTPGGVNSNLRMLAVPRPLFFERGAGPRIWDVDGNQYLDYVLGQGPLIHGHSHPELLAAAEAGMRRGMMFAAQHPDEVRLAEAIHTVHPAAERVRVGSSGSEVVQAALRLARAATGRSCYLKFEGHYHGWFDNVLVSVAPPLDRAGPRESPHGVPGTSGVAPGALADLKVLPWNDLDLLESTLRRHKDELAAVITEPIMCNVGCILPRAGFLARLRELCSELGIVLVFDEVITGFRVAPGGASEYLGVAPDLVTFGKAMAGGFPVAGMAGKAELMDLLTQGVNHSGTYNGNLLVVAASIACLDLLTRDGGAYGELFRLGAKLRDGIAAVLRAAGFSVQVQGPGPMFHVAFCDQPLTDYRSSLSQNTPLYHRFAAELLTEGVRVLERGLWYLSTTHTESEIDQTLAAVEKVAARLSG